MRETRTRQKQILYMCKTIIRSAVKCNCKSLLQICVQDGYSVVYLRPLSHDTGRVLPSQRVVMM